MAKRSKKDEKKDEKKNEVKSKSRVDWEFVEKLLAHPKIRTMYIYGPPGVGKTFAAYTWAASTTASTA